MSYTAKDKSVHDGEPLECYKFVTVFGEFLYTSEPAPVTLGGDVYLPIPITRTSIEIGSIVDTEQTMDFNIPHDDPLAKAACYTQSPTELTVEVYRAHRGDDLATDFVVEYTGESIGSAAAGKWATIKTAGALQTKLNGSLSLAYYQGACNHILFDERCKAVRADFTTETTVTKIQGQIITVADDGVLNNVLNGGEIINTRTGEVRSIIDNISNKVRIGYRFIDLIVGDTVTLTRGCDHARLGDCKGIFDNVVNYGGFDFVPLENPFVDLNKANNTFVETTVKKKRVTEFGLPGMGMS